MGIWSSPSLRSLPGPLWPGVEAPDRVLSMCPLELNRSFLRVLFFFSFRLRIYAELNRLIWNCFAFVTFQIKVDLEVIAMNGHSTLPRSPELAPHHQM